jgi:TetR/AcrR family fatty acid metabolism transcriptional regulator
VRDKAATRVKILRAAETVFAKKGYYESLVEEIAQASQTSKGAIYFHFPSKEELFSALMERLAKSLLQDVEASISQQQGAVAKIEAALEAVMRHLLQQRKLAQILLVQSLFNPAFARKRLEIFDQFAQLIQRYLDEAIEEGSISPVDSRIVAHAWLGAIHELVVRWLYVEKPSLKRALPALTQLFLHGIGIERNPRSRKN